MRKRLLSIILSVAVALTMIPLFATVSYAENAEADYLTFTSSGSTTVSFAHWADSTNLQYSIDGGVNWNVANSKTKIPLGDGETVKFKGEGGNVFSNDNYLRFKIDGEEDGTIAAMESAELVADARVKLQLLDQVEAEKDNLKKELEQFEKSWFGFYRKKDI